MPRDRHRIHAAEVLLPCADLDATLAFFSGPLGFRVDAIFPADDPRTAVVSGHGVRLRLQRDAGGDPGRLCVLCDDPDAVAGGARELTAPNGTHIELVPAQTPLVVPPLRPSFVLTRLETDRGWHAGRAGMRYRDLIPGRQGGHLVGSHIAVPAGGPVPDYVHFHRVHCQVIHCWRGRVRVVYQDQGEPFWLEPGDTVLQPPGIRHRVLECSPGLEVVEVTCPAEHETLADHELELPTPEPQPGRAWCGQRFVHHRVAEAAWQPWQVPGFLACDTGIAAATGGLADVRVVRADGAATTGERRHPDELCFGFVLAGGATLARTGQPPEPLAAGDAWVAPPGAAHAVTDCTPDLRWLRVALPAPVTP